MQKNRLQRFLFCYKIFTASLCVISGLGLICACLYLCIAADQTFTRESVISSLHALAPLLSVTACTIIGGFALEFLFPVPADKEYAGCASVSAAPAGKARTMLRLLIIIVATVLLLAGVFCGGSADVLTKAINICSECIRIG